MDILSALIAAMEEGSSQLSGTIKTIVYSVLAVMLVISLLQCFFGYKLIKFWISLTGFFVGGLLGTMIAITMRTDSMVTVIVLALILGALGAWLAFKLYKVGVFFQCFISGFLFGAIIGYYIGKENGIVPSGLICGLAAGILGVVLIKPVFIITTGISGGTTAGSCLAILLNSQNLDMGIVFGLIIAALGIYVQFIMDRKKVQNKMEVSVANSQASTAVYPETQNMPLETDECKCPVCGRPCTSDEKFCPKCGHALTERE